MVFRPATQRRALLSGARVELHAACRSCGETLSIEWSLEEFNEPLVQLDERRAAHAERHAEPVAMPVTLPMAAGGEQWAAAHEATHRTASTGEQQPAAPTYEQTAEPSWQEWEPAARSSANPVIAPAPVAEVVAAPTDTPVDRGDLDEFLGAFASRVERARTNLERMRVELPSVISDEGLRRPALRSPARLEAEAQAIARPSFVEPVADEPIVAAPAFAAPVELAPEPIVQSAPEQVAHVAPEPVAVVTDVAQEPVVELAAEPAMEFITEPVTVPVDPEPVALEYMAEPVEVEVAPESVAAAPQPAVASSVPLHERVQVASTDPEVFGTSTAAVATATDAALDVWGAPALELPPIAAIAQRPAVADEPALVAATTQPVAVEPVLVAVEHAEPSIEATPDLGDSFATFADPDADVASDDDRGFDWSGEDDAEERPRRRRGRKPRAQRAPREDRPRAGVRMPSGLRLGRTARPGVADAPTAVLAAVAVAPTAPGELRVRMGLPQVAIVVLLAAVAGIAFMKLVSTPEIVPPASTRVTGAGAGAPSTSAVPDVPTTPVPSADAATTPKAAGKLPTVATPKVASPKAATPKVATPKVATAPGATVAGAPNAPSATAPPVTPQVPASAADTADKATTETSPSSNPFAPA